MDSDGDLCLDVFEAGFTDTDQDGQLGTSDSVNACYQVSITEELSSVPRLYPHINYSIGALLKLQHNPSFEICEYGSKTLEITSPIWPYGNGEKVWTPQIGKIFQTTLPMVLPCGLFRNYSIPDENPVIYYRAKLTKRKQLYLPDIFGNSCALPNLSETRIELCKGSYFDLKNLEENTSSTSSSYSYYDTYDNASAGTPELTTTNVSPEFSRSYFVKLVENDPTKATICENIVEVELQVNVLERETIFIARILT